MTASQGCTRVVRMTRYGIRQGQAQDEQRLQEVASMELDTRIVGLARSQPNGEILWMGIVGTGREDEQDITGRDSTSGWCCRD